MAGGSEADVSDRTLRTLEQKLERLQCLRVGHSIPCSEIFCYPGAQLPSHSMPLICVLPTHVHSIGDMPAVQGTAQAQAVSPLFSRRCRSRKGYTTGDGTKECDSTLA